MNVSSHGTAVPFPTALKSWAMSSYQTHADGRLTTHLIINVNAVKVERFDPFGHALREIGGVLPMGGGCISGSKGGNQERDVMGLVVSLVRGALGVRKARPCVGLVCRAVHEEER